MDKINKNLKVYSLLNKEILEKLKIIENELLEIQKKIVAEKKIENDEKQYQETINGSYQEYLHKMDVNPLLLLSYIENNMMVCNVIEESNKNLRALFQQSIVLEKKYSECFFEKEFVEKKIEILEAVRSINISKNQDNEVQELFSLKRRLCGIDN